MDEDIVKPTNLQRRNFQALTVVIVLFWQARDVEGG